MNALDLAMASRLEWRRLAERYEAALKQIRDDMLCDPKQVAIDALEPVTNGDNANG